MSKYNKYWRAACQEIRARAKSVDQTKPKPKTKPVIRPAEPDIRPVDQAIRTVVEKHCDFGPDRWLICNDLYKAYNAYWTTPIPPAYFSRRLAAIYPDIKKRRRRINGELHYVYEGLAIKQAVKQNL